MMIAKPAAEKTHALELMLLNRLSLDCPSPAAANEAAGKLPRLFVEIVDIFE